jgi:phage gp46-like protein
MVNANVILVLCRQTEKDVLFAQQALHSMSQSNPVANVTSVARHAHHKRLVLVAKMDLSWTKRNQNVFAKD